MGAVYGFRSVITDNQTRMPILSLIVPGVALAHDRGTEHGEAVWLRGHQTPGQMPSSAGAFEVQPAAERAGVRCWFSTCAFRCVNFYLLEGAGDTGPAMGGGAMAWSIADVARMSRVTSRTLRHYDEIGLLPPAWIGSNGHRYYEEADLLRLQQILLMRELGLGLREIKAVLDSQVDQLAALRGHHRRLLAERDRLEGLARTVGRTIAALEEGEDNSDMAKINRPENLFEGFEPSSHESEARERWPEQWEQSQRAIAGMTAEGMEQWQREVTAQMIRMAEFMVAGTPVADPAVQAEVDAHYRGVCRFWTPCAAAYKGLGQTYVDDPRFRANFDQIADGLGIYQRDAMAVYADARLS